MVARPAAGKKRRACSDDSPAAKDPEVYVDVVGIAGDDLDKRRPSSASDSHASKKPKPAPSFKDTLSPARRSLRIAEKRSLEEFEVITSQQTLTTVSICT
ncbi:hypothetical protein LPJ75_006875 [Coemansia sp. RSA 2598]|nr:hypothetical protein LPJ75_006875 [Coemansia sp. RSA 2598]